MVLAENDFFYKRSSNSGHDSATETEASVERMAKQAKKKAAGHSARLAQAKKALLAGKESETEIEMEKKLRGQAFRKPAAVEVDAEPGISDEILGKDLERMVGFEILQRANKRSQKILEIALKSSNLKCGYVRDLKIAAKDMAEMVEVLTVRTAEEESRQLRDQALRLCAESSVNTTLTAPANPAPQAQAGIRRIRATESTKPVERVKPTKGDGLAGLPKAKVSLGPPSTAAVVITLSKDAVAGGATYAWALTAAKQRVSLADIGVKEVRTRKTALGSRILEMGGPERSQQADRLAEEIRGALAGVATVNRPVKYVDVRISGLEDSVTLDDVVGAVAARGNVPREHVRAGRISMGSTIVKCPTTAAKAIMQDRLCIGWSTVRVILLEARPLRCFRCYGIGHGSATCTAKDRSFYAVTAERRGHLE
ncbi:unnamed protein product [Leptidea sinapis]|uniref:Gag-like protein n=1 Tax=Leptidea sinapis TaxID=189913 RepID=A0A5E4QNX7_9NEOP|nr:unnamed protein product [Leptidea sinapis]